MKHIPVGSLANDLRNRCVVRILGLEKVPASTPDGDEDLVYTVSNGTGSSYEALPQDLKPYTRQQNRFVKLLESKGSISAVSTERPIAHADGFPPTPKAGVFTPDDLRALNAQYEKSRRVHANPLTDKPAKEERRETLSNTTRYRQAPGESAIYGGRK
jgi:hypothetical protein